MRRMTAMGVAVLTAAVVGGCRTTPESGKKIAVKAEPAPKTEAPAFCVRVNCGAGEAYEDKAGNTWMADQTLFGDATWGAEGGTTVMRPVVEIPGTDCPKVYLSERFNMTSYTFQVPDGTYTLKLHFAETFDGILAAGERVFSVTVNDEMVIADLDPYEAGGGLHKPVVKTVKKVKPQDGKIVIGFKENIQNPLINGIEIMGR